MGRGIFVLIGLLLSLWGSAAPAQVMFVGSADLGTNGSASMSLSGNYTAGSGANEVLVACTYDQQQSGNTEALTFNGVAMTRVAATVGVTWPTAVWYLLSPSPGTHTLSFTRTGGTADYIEMLAADYSGAQQSGQLDNSGQTTDAVNEDTYSGTTTTSTDGSGLIGCAFNGGSTLTPSTSGAYTTRVTDGTNKNNMIADDVGPIIPHGNVTFTATIANGGTPQQQSWISVLSVSNGLLLRGVGP